MLTTPPEMDVSCPAYKSWIDNGPLHLNNIIEIGKPIDFGTGITIFKIKSRFLTAYEVNTYGQLDKLEEKANGVARKIIKKGDLFCIFEG